MKLKEFFDPKKVMDAVERARVIALRKGGAAIRAIAQKSIQRRKRSSFAGSPPSSHAGDLKKLIFFDYDPSSRSEVIGPIPAGRNTGVPGRLEFGGTITRGGRTLRYRKFPFMGPALDKAAPKLNSDWENSVKG